MLTLEEFSSFLNSLTHPEEITFETGWFDGTPDPIAYQVVYMEMDDDIIEHTDYREVPAFPLIPAPNSRE